mmetsp:Transcript_1872/g.11231  ORF Transcript_1872/g.11231 Transcript_1872/m.11231 type:complete len:233 (+) Transcript_1872:2819-3517(+)
MLSRTICHPQLVQQPVPRFQAVQLLLPVASSLNFQRTAWLMCWKDAFFLGLLPGQHSLSRFRAFPLLPGLVAHRLTEEQDHLRTRPWLCFGRCPLAAFLRWFAVLLFRLGEYRRWFRLVLLWCSCCLLFLPRSSSLLRIRNLSCRHGWEQKANFHPTRIHTTTNLGLETKKDAPIRSDSHRHMQLQTTPAQVRVLKHSCMLGPPLDVQGCLLRVAWRWRADVNEQCWMDCFN